MRLPLIAVVLSLASSPASAAFLDLTQVSYGANNTLVIGGVTITGQDGGLVSVVAGKGLGSGVDGSIDRVDKLDYEPNQSPKISSTIDPRLSLSVNGFFNSITFTSYFVVDGPATKDPLVAIPLTGRAFAPGKTSLPFFVTIPLGVNSSKLDFASLDYRANAISDLGLYTDSTVDSWFRGYLVQNGFPDVTFSYGISITGIDYTLNPTPEPSTLLLFSVGLLATVLYRRHRESNAC